MKRLVAAALLVPGLLCAAQQETVHLEDLIQSANDWALENLDEDFLRVLQQADEDKVRRVFEQMQQRLQGDYVLDLAGFKDTARDILPLLEPYEETAPYAFWLKSRLDYFIVADQLRVIVQEPGRAESKAPRPRSQPTVKVEREVWRARLKNSPLPNKAASLVSQLKPVFSSEKVPPELVWIAEVESSFDPRAKSPAGAAGLFQLMPATAKQHGLRHWPADQRFMPEPSARAAAKHLRELHGKFKDWPLVLAAYNAGEGRVGKAVGKRKAATFEEIAPQLPAETQMYVPRVEAVLLRREGVALAQLQAPDTRPKND